MDNYVKSKIKNVVIKDPDREYVIGIVKKFKEICKNDPEGFIKDVNQNKNSVHAINSIFDDLKTFLHSSHLDMEVKRIIFYYSYYYDTFVRDNELQNHKDRRKIYNVKLRKPNNYTGKIDNKDIYFKVVSREDRIVKNYKIMELYNIRMPYIDLNFKNILVTEDNEKVKVPLEREAFLQILSILRQFNSNNLFVYFSKWNIRKVGTGYYLLNLEKISNRVNLECKKQLSLLLPFSKDQVDLSKYRDRIEIYDEIVRDLYQN